MSKKEHYNIGMRAPMPKTKLDKLIEVIQIHSVWSHVGNNDKIKQESIINMDMAKQFFEAVDEAIECYSGKEYAREYWKKWEKLRELFK